MRIEGKEIDISIFDILFTFIIYKNKMVLNLYNKMQIIKYNIKIYFINIK